MVFEHNNILTFLASIFGSYVAALFALRNIKSEISYAWWHKEQANALKELYSSLSELEIAVKQLIPILTSTKEDEILCFNKRYPDLNGIYKKTYHLWMRNRILLEADINKQINTMIDKCNLIVIKYGSAIKEGKKDEETRQRFEAEVSIVDFTNILENIRQCFQDILKGNL